MTKIFLDTEFTGLHQHTTLISLGLAAESGELFYAELTDYDRSQLNPWLMENVLSGLSGSALPEAGSMAVAPQTLCVGNQASVAHALRQWLAQFGGPTSVEIWADVLAWDWVLFCELFGGAFSIPEQLHYIPRDLSTLLALKGIDPDRDRETLGRVEWSHPELKLARHHALYDALLENDIHHHLMTLAP